MEKARNLPADGIIMDLEDAVAPETKAVARNQVVDALTKGGYGRREVIVRINPLVSPWGHEDMAAMARVPVDAILLPKVEAPEAVHAAVAKLDEVGAPSDLPIWIMVETPRGILQINAIAGCHIRLACMVMGTSDLAKELRLIQTRDRTALLTSLSLAILAARANRLDIIDGVFRDLNDQNGFRAACEQARALGFDGKSLIHPKQIEPANDAFTPSEQEIAEATEILSAWKLAQKEGKGVVLVKGRMVENLHVEEARRVLALRSAIAEMA
jgi:citrate lyase subunit beta/citryl-CoA lyase